MPPDMRINFKTLLRSCIEPDRSTDPVRRNISGHFVDIDNLRSDPPDAFHLAKKYTQAAIEAHRKKNYAKRDECFGLASHYAQDIGPHHTVFEELAPGHPERIAHRDLELGVQKTQRKVIEKAKLPEQTSSVPFWDKTMPEAMRNAKNQYFQVKNEKDPEKISKIAEEALLNTYRTTIAFFEEFARMINKARTPKRIGLHSSAPKRKFEAVV